MKLTTYILVLFLANTLIQAQPNLEIAIPIGLSNYVQNEIGDNYREVSSPIQSKYHLSTGLDVRIAPWSFKHFEFLFSGNYLRLQYRASQTLEQESFSWTYKSTRIRYANHLLGLSVIGRINFINTGKHTAGLNLQIGYLYSTGNETWIKQERKSYYDDQTKEFEIYSSNQRSFKIYSNYSTSLVYLYGKDRFKWLFEIGFNYIDESSFVILEESVNDWRNFYIKAGFKQFLIAPDSKELE